jgi:protein TonB
MGAVRMVDVPRPRHGLSVVGSVAVHLLVAYALLGAPKKSDDDLDAVSFTVEHHRPPPPAEPEPPPPEPPPPEPEPVRPRMRVAEPAAPEPPPEAPPPEAPPAPPVFDMSNLATGTDGSWGIQTTEGNTLFGPVRRQAVSKNTAPVRPPGVPGGTGTGPATSAPRITRRPEVEFEATASYPEEARREQVSGVVVLVVQVLASGRVGTVRIKPGTDPGYGLGRAAVEAMRRFRFSPALDQDGRPVGYTIESYRFRFELPD